MSNGYSFAVRGSGTEPKIKFYVFGRSEVTEPEQLKGVKETAAQVMGNLLQLIEADAHARADALAGLVGKAICENNFIVGKLPSPFIGWF